MRPPDPVDVLELFVEDRTALLNLLTTLDAGDWERATLCAGWSVNDVAGHILGTIAHLHVEGQAGGDWSVVREPNGWQLYLAAPAAAAERVERDQDRAWHPYTKGITPHEAQQRSGSQATMSSVESCDTVAIIA